MPLESAQYINSLNAAYPVNTDPISDGDNHIRLIKAAIKATFPNITGAVNATQAELNSLAGLTTPLADQLASKASKTITITSNNGITGGGTLEADRTIGLTGNALQLHQLTGVGYIAKTSSGYSVRTLEAGTGLTLTHPAGDAGNTQLTLNLASDTEGIDGVLATKVMTPAATKAAISNQVVIPTVNIAAGVAAIGAGAVGSMVFAYCASTLSYGNTVAGSALYPTSALYAVTSGAADNFLTLGTSGALSGTWRCLGQQTPLGSASLSTNGTALQGKGATLFVRIA
jgi:hypothetical protein